MKLLAAVAMALALSACTVTTHKVKPVIVKVENNGVTEEVAQP